MEWNQLMWERCSKSKCSLASLLKKSAATLCNNVDNKPGSEEQLSGRTDHSMFPLMSEWEQHCLTVLEVSPYTSKLTAQTVSFKVQHSLCGHMSEAMLVNALQHAAASGFLRSYLGWMQLPSSQKEEMLLKVLFWFRDCMRESAWRGECKAEHLKTPSGRPLLGWRLLLCAMWRKQGHAGSLKSVGKKDEKPNGNTWF